MTAALQGTSRCKITQREFSKLMIKHIFFDGFKSIWFDPKIPFLTKKPASLLSVTWMQHQEMNRCTLTHLHLMFWALFFFFCRHTFSAELPIKEKNPSWVFARNFCNDVKITVQKVPYVQISNSHFVMCSLYQCLKDFACKYQLKTGVSGC